MYIYFKRSKHSHIYICMYVYISFVIFALHLEHNYEKSIKQSHHSQKNQFLKTRGPQYTQTTFKLLCEFDSQRPTAVWYTP